MIIVMKKNAKKGEIKDVIDYIKHSGLEPTPLYGTERSVIAAIGDEKRINKDSMSLLSGIEKIHSLTKPYKLASIEGKRAAFLDHCA